MPPFSVNFFMGNSAVFLLPIDGLACLDVFMQSDVYFTWSFLQVIVPLSRTRFVLYHTYLAHADFLKSFFPSRSLLGPSKTTQD
jgi:hypothetical protein